MVAPKKREEKTEPNENKEPINGRTVRVMLYGCGLFLVLTVLLCGAALEKEAAALPYGPHRERMLRVARPLGAVSRFLRADGWRRALSASAGRWLNGEKGESK